MQYIDGGKHDKAIEAYESAIALKKDHINAWNNIGLLYENLSELLYCVLQLAHYTISMLEGMYDKAEEIMRRGISENPNAAQLYSSLGILLGRQNRLEVISFYPQHSIIRLYTGRRENAGESG